MSKPEISLKISDSRTVDGCSSHSDRGSFIGKRLRSLCQGYLSLHSVRSRLRKYRHHGTGRRDAHPTRIFLILWSGHLARAHPTRIFLILWSGHLARAHPTRIFLVLWGGHLARIKYLCHHSDKPEQKLLWGGHLARIKYFFSKSINQVCCSASL